MDFYIYCLDFCEKYNLRWRIAGNLLPNRRTAFGSSIDIHSPNSALIQLRPCLVLHPPVAFKPCLTVDKSILSWYILYVMENYGI